MNRLAAISLIVWLATTFPARGSDISGAPTLVTPVHPDSFVVHQEGDIFEGAFEKEDGNTVVMKEIDGDVETVQKYFHKDGRLQRVRNRVSNEVLDRSVERSVSISYDEKGRISSKTVHLHGEEYTMTEYIYGGLDVPDGAVVRMRGAIVERIEYEYGKKAWGNPLYLRSGFAFGQINIYSTNNGTRTHFLAAEYEPETWALQSYTVHATDYYPEERVEFMYSGQNPGGVQSESGDRRR